MPSNNVNQAPTFVITDAKLYIPVVTLSAEEYPELLQQLKSVLNRAINWNKYNSKVTTQAKKQYLHYLIDPSFQGVNRLFVFPCQAITMS